MNNKRGNRKFPTLSNSLWNCKRGWFFSIDALIALSLIVLILVVFYPFVDVQQKQTEVHYDLLKTLSVLDAGNGKSVLEEMGEIYLSGGEAEATNYITPKLQGLDFGNENVGIWINDDLIWVSSGSIDIVDASRIESARQMVFGLREGENAVGYSALATLGGGARQDYFYFGGYVGDGDITQRVYYDAGTITYAEIEAVISDDFDLYINNILIGNYLESADEFTPSTYVIGNPDNYFNPGENIVEFKGEDLHIAGGFIKIVYDNGVQYEQQERYYFPGIDGIVNLYDGFYVPGDLTGMTINLHLDSEDIDPFLRIGGVTVFQDYASGGSPINLNNAQLDALLDYVALSRTTVPIRIGLEENIEGEAREIDVFSVAELSGSVNQNVPSVGKKVLQLIKEGNEVFINVVLTNLGSRIGLVAFDKDADDENRNHALSNDQNSLVSTVNSWSGGAPTCVCCGINKAVDKLLVQSSEDSYRSIVLMSDGNTNKVCSEQGTGSAEGDAIQAACDAYAQGIEVHVIGFGPTTTVDEVTLQAIATCGHGAYIYSDANLLAEAYTRIANLISVYYSKQEVGVTGNVEMELFKDSYIEFDYVKEDTPYGLVLTLEDDFDDSNSGSFNVPSSATAVLESKVTSYSGWKWTNVVKLNDANVYDLSTYGTDYILLGDPFIIDMPADSVNIGADNLVSLTTGVEPGPGFSGSVSNKVIYKLLTDASAFSSDIKLNAEGCIWSIEFEGGTTLDVAIPSSYAGEDTCFYNSLCYNQECSLTNEQDAYQDAVFRLLDSLDLGGVDGRVDTKFDEQQLVVDVDEVTGIPFTLNMEVEARTWYA